MAKKVEQQNLEEVRRLGQQFKNKEDANSEAKKNAIVTQAIADFFKTPISTAGGKIYNPQNKIDMSKYGSGKK